MKPENPTQWPALGASQVDVVVVNQSFSSEAASDWVADEQPIALSFNGISHAIMLATPADLEDFALGFAVTEGIVENAGHFYGSETVESCEGITVEIDIAASCFAQLKEKRRNMTGRTGCGLCGTESLSQVVRALPALGTHEGKVPATAINQALLQLREHQTLQQVTGATHAAAWFDTKGAIQLIREDVGRHNALDKLIGAGLRGKRADWQQGMLVVTSRASMEMVQKTVMAGFAILIAISAPTKMAIELARAHNLCLIGFAKPDRWTIYSHAERIEGLSK